MVGKIDGGTRRKAGQQYFDRMRRAAIVVTANPGKWEGDFRLWEAMASKALVFVDELFAPMPCPLIHGQDLIFYDPYDRRSFEEKIRYYLAHPDEARRIAMSGFRKAVRCHRWVNRVDYIMSTAAYLLEPGFKVTKKASYYIMCRPRRLAVPTPAPVHHLTHIYITPPPSQPTSGVGHLPEGDHDAHERTGVLWDDDADPCEACC